LLRLEAFLWRFQHFPQLLFVLVEPNRLALEGKKAVTGWWFKSYAFSIF
jgi:hypothetical protein